MKRILGLSMLVILMLTVSAGIASANWGLDLVAVGDTEDGDFLTDGDATDFEVVYWSDTGYVWWTNGMTLYIDEVGAPANFTFTPDGFNWGLVPPDDFDWNTGYQNLPTTGDQGAFVVLAWASTSNLTHAMTGQGITDPETQPRTQVLGRLVSPTGTAIQWGTNPSFLLNENVPLSNPPTQIAVWNNDGTPDPFDMFGADMLLTDGTTSNPGGNPGPTPPIPEIITIVLISIGVVALGGYVWYRRNRQQAALVA